MDENTLLIRLSEYDAEHTGRSTQLQDVISAVFDSKVSILENQQESVAKIIKHLELEKQLKSSYELVEMPFGVLMRPKK